MNAEVKQYGGRYFVCQNGVIIGGPFDSNADAWKRLDELDEVATSDENKRREIRTRFTDRHF